LYLKFKDASGERLPKRKGKNRANNLSMREATKKTDREFRARPRPSNTHRNKRKTTLLSDLKKQKPSHPYCRTSKLKQLSETV
jgi:hypothetical protein